jgi:hypothetical protein
LALKAYRTRRREGIKADDLKQAVIAFAAAMKEAGFKMAAEGAAVDTVKGKKQRLWIVRPCAKLEKLDAKGAGEYYVNERARKKARQPRVAKERK